MRLARRLVADSLPHLRDSDHLYLLTEVRPTQDYHKPQLQNNI